MVPFDLKRAVILAVFGASFAWLNSRNATPDHSTASDPLVREARPHLAEPAVTITPLHEWRPRNAAPPARARNVFAFNAAAPKSYIAAKRPVDSTPPAVPPQPLPVPLPFRLVGLAEDASPSGPVRTAVISGSEQLFVVRDGEMVTSRYRVASISPDRVELADLETGITVRLMFK
jgi:hypothetical protein